MNRYTWSGLTIWLLPLLALLINFYPALAPAVEYGPPLKINVSLAEDYAYPQINNDGWVVWWHELGGIYLVKPLVQVTDNTGAFDAAPQVLEDGRLLWQGWDGHDYEIYCQEPGQDPTQLTDNDSPDVMPQISAGGDLVWMNWDGGDWEVCYDFGEGPVLVTDNTGAFDVLPQITADGRIYWQG